MEENVEKMEQEEGEEAKKKRLEKEEKEKKEEEDEKKWGWRRVPMVDPFEHLKHPTYKEEKDPAFVKEFISIMKKKLPLFHEDWEDIDIVIGPPYRDFDVYTVTIVIQHKYFPIGQGNITLKACTSRDPLKAKLLALMDTNNFIDKQILKGKPLPSVRPKQIEEASLDLKIESVFL